MFLSRCCATGYLDGLRGEMDGERVTRRAAVAIDEEVFDATARFEVFARDARPRLVRALVPIRGVDGATDAAAEALAYAWEHWDAVRSMENPVGYLYRVAQSRSRGRRTPPLPAVTAAVLPEVEPGLVPALLELPATQRGAVWLVHACGWSYAEAAAALDMSVTAVGTHVARGLAALRSRLGATT
jgi:DNA-directed RNA polymerase specialized sigma24 family protein